MNKILTVSIAAYNVENFIKNALDSLLIDNIKDVEILVQDDGGNDNTGEIVKKYEKKYPNIVKLIHKENGGYGSTINNSIQIARGKYFKQLDGDDWYKKDNFKKFLEILRNTDADVVYTPYTEVYEKKGKNKLIDFFEHELNGEYIIDDVLLKNSEHLKMYSVAYKTNIYRENNIKLLEHCLYTDTEYALYPIIHCNTIYITHIPLYMYRIGREGQSIGFESRIKHYKEHITVSKTLIDFYIKNVPNISTEKKLYIQKYIGNILACTIGGFLIFLPHNKQKIKMIKDFEKYVYNKNEELYYMMEKVSRLVKILRKSNYKLCRILAFMKKIKLLEIRSEK